MESRNPMTQLTFQIPDDLARHLEAIAAAQRKSIEQVAVERLRSGLDGVDSPAAVLRAIRESPRPSSAAMDDLDASLASSRLPVRDEGAFDGWPIG
jgi:plasmid stability protein